MSVKNTLHDLLPQATQAIINEYAQVLIQPILDLKDYKSTLRDFHNKNESIEVYNSTYAELIEECEKSNDIIDKVILTPRLTITIYSKTLYTYQP